VSGCVEDCLVEDFALTPAERALFGALNARGVRFILIGMGAAVLEGAPIATQDLDVWFEAIADDRIPEAAKDAGGFWISGFGMQPPSFGGAGLDRIDVVLTAHGLEDFDREHARTIEMTIDGIQLRVLPLDRVIASKRSANRLKDQAALPALEATLLAKRRRRLGE
jgi:predicted nucleotidyltransferase